MESDDGTVACIALHIVQYLFRAHPFTIITSYEIPHDNAVMIAQGIILPESHVSVWRTEEIGMNNFVYLSGVCEVIRIRIFKSTDVVEGMVTDAVSVFYHHPVFIRVLAYIVAYHKEGSFNMMLFQYFQYPGSYFRDGTVVKSQIDCPFIRIHPEDSLWIQRPEKPRWLFYKHESLC